MAAAAALQMGLLSGSMHCLSPEDKACARSITTVLFITDAYITTALGLPRTLRDIDLDRLAPALDSKEKLQVLEIETVAHAGVVKILARIMEDNHPATKRIPQSNGFYGVQYSHIVQAEDRLTTWFDQLNALPSLASPSGDDHSLRYMECSSS